MATVPEGKTIYIGKKKYKASEELPKDYKLKTQVSTSQKKASDEK